MHRLGMGFTTCVAVISAAFLIGCLPRSSTGALKAESASLKREVVIDANYQQVYKDLVETARACDEATIPLFGGQDTIQAELYSDLGKAEASFVGIAAAGRFVYATADIERIDATHTKLTLYPAKKFGWVADNWTRWAQGDANCSKSAAQPASGTPGGPPTRNLNDAVTQ